LSRPDANIVELERVSFNFGSSWALQDVSLALGKGEFLFLTGPSGAGKTTLLKLLYAALPLRRGTRANVCGFDLKRIRRGRVPMLRREIGVVFQDFKILPRRTVFANVAMALEVRGMARHVIERRVRAVLRVLRLENKAYEPCVRLSGGEQQRVAIARSVVVNPKLILADEPTGNLDAGLSRRLMDVFKQFHVYGTSIIMATHSAELLDTVPEAKVLHLQDGRMCTDDCQVESQPGPLSRSLDEEGPDAPGVPSGGRR
jgi:cell division transport system ATP-binding protein